MSQACKVAGYMARRTRVRILPTVIVGPQGQVDVELGISSYRAGFAGLLDLNPPRAHVAILPERAPTSLAFARIGAALRSSFTKARARHAA